MTEKTPYEVMAESIGFGQSKMVPELLAMIIDDVEARILLAASPPGTAEELADKTGLTVAETSERLQRLFVKGLIYKSKKPEATRYYRFRSYIQFHDGTVLTPGISQAYLDKWKEFEATELPLFLEAVKSLEVTRPGMRVVPVNITVESQKAVAVPDDVCRMINEASKIAVTNCSCRTIHGITEVPLEVCMQLNKAAEYALDRGTGRELSRQEALEMLRRCESEGLVHCVENKAGLGHLICNCDNVGCGNWGVKDRAYAKKFTAPSRFRARVSAELCTACENCLDRCFFGAIAMSGPNDTAVIDAERCMGCGVCIPTCSGDAIRLDEVEPLTFIPA